MREKVEIRHDYGIVNMSFGGKMAFRESGKWRKVFSKLRKEIKLIKIYEVKPSLCSFEKFC